MQSEKKKRGRPRKNPLAETSGMTYEGAINYALDKEIKSELETQLSNKSEPLTAEEKKYLDSQQNNHSKTLNIRFRQHRTIEKRRKVWYNNDMDRQMTLAEMNDEFGAARTNKKEFLEKMDSLIPWAAFVRLVKPFYYKGERGNKPYPLELMLRIFILQNLYDLADMKVMNEVLDSRAFTAFCCINTPDEVPNGDTIGRFRNFLTEHGLQKMIFDEIVRILTEKGLILKKEQSWIPHLLKHLRQPRIRRKNGIRKRTLRKRVPHGISDTKHILE